MYNRLWSKCSRKILGVFCHRQGRSIYTVFKKTPTVFDYNSSVSWSIFIMVRTIVYQESTIYLFNALMTSQMSQKFTSESYFLTLNIFSFENKILIKKTVKMLKFYTRRQIKIS